MAAASTLARARQAVDAGRHARIVGHATLMPACADDAQQLRFAVEDALNTADFGDAGRLVLVRRLRLRDLPPRASPALVARAMEAAWRDVALRAVPAAHTSAATAEAVFFASRFEARMAWLWQVAASQPPAAWFWPAALPELKAAGPAPVATTIARVMVAALQDSTPAVVAALTRWPDLALAALSRAMPIDSQRQLLQVLTAPVPGSRMAPLTDGATHRFTVGLSLQRQRPLARRLAACAPLNEAAATLLAALWLEPELRRRPSLDEVRALVGSTAWVTGQTAALRADGAVEADEPWSDLKRLAVPNVHAPHSERRALIAGMPANEPARPGASAASPTRPTARQMESGLPPQPRPAALARAARIAAQPGWPWLADAAFSRCGGLMLVLNVLAALRFPRWLESLEAGERRPFVFALLAVCLDFSKGGDDPQSAWFDADSAHHPATRLWTLRLRRTLRRHARMDLAELVRRPAWVSATPTHIDVIYALDDVDLRLRRLGLDADPGWVPWLGRIVHFHFIDARLLPAESAHG